MTDLASNLLSNVVNFIPQVQHNRIIFLLSQLNISWQFDPYHIESLAVENKHTNEILYIHNDKISYSNYRTFSINIIDNTVYYNDIINSKKQTYNLQGAIQCNIADDVYITYIADILSINNVLSINMLSKAITFYSFNCIEHNTLSLSQDGMIVKLTHTQDNTISNIGINVVYQHTNDVSINLLYAVSINHLRLQFVHITYQWSMDNNTYAYDVLKSNHIYKIITTRNNISKYKEYKETKFLLVTLLHKLYKNTI